MTHGTLTGYAARHCRCGPCSAASYRYEKRRRLDKARGHARLVPATGTRRRIQALMWLGWPRTEIAARLGVTTAAIKLWMGQERVQSRTADRVAKVFDELCMTRGPSNITAGKAKALGHVGPLAWDNIDTDEAPNVGARGPTRIVHAEDVDWLLSQEDYTWDGLAARLGVGRDTIARALYRAGRPDLVAVLTRHTHGVAA